MKTVRQRSVVDGRGKKRAVIISIREYRRLREDLHDLAVVAERSKERPIGLEEMRNRLKSGRVGV
jgi:PHD/YefM family antitoxin component YafN of YafNO toxin-antitoxin module